jgi:hypothetical protein
MLALLRLSACKFANLAACISISAHTSPSLYCKLRAPHIVHVLCMVELSRQCRCTKKEPGEQLAMFGLAATETVAAACLVLWRHSHPLRICTRACLLSRVQSHLLIFWPTSRSGSQQARYLCAFLSQPATPGPLMFGPSVDEASKRAPAALETYWKG